MKVYIAGKMRGLPLYGFPLFDSARDMLIKRGFDVVSPADLDRAEGFDPAGTAVVTEEFVQNAFRRDFAAILTCDAIALLPNWEESGGARAELEVAQRIGLRVFYISFADNSIMERTTQRV